MSYVSLVLLGLRRKPVRTILTSLAIMVAFVLFGIMNGVVAGFDDAVDQLSDARLRVMNRASILEPMPFAYGAQIAGMEGVRAVAIAAIFVGYYQELINPVSGAAVDPDTFFDVLPEMTLAADQMEVFKRTRTGFVAGIDLVDRYGWKIGDRVPLQSHIWVTESGSRSWELDLVGVVRSWDDESLSVNEVYFHYDYLDETRANGKGTASQYIVSIDDPAQSAEIGAAIDALFANSSNETLTLNEKDYIRAQVRQIGDVRTFVTVIIGAVLFTLLFLSGTTMAQSVRERLPEFGVLKSMGFTDTTLFVMVLAESLLICCIAAAVGLLLAATIFPGVFRAMQLPASELPPVTWISGMAIAVVLALLVGLWPALRARRLAIVDAIGDR